ncbi:hypothetical protein [Pseudoalteromonas luteoviolacea]|uniref:Uncharacterized protein n=1 Tax=Pseudoalteromonas luteoviolacea S4054 TaxID=1129367 RepID=A0A0F6ADA6_9GAMM|nr:hypothetical protein [Pseudoalteromonas luteoviolacea]AOT08271.1 hypothetical protein S4054249_10645 [Pseudoalteromonas luteoviolacea]AOT13187.1 hypothetical protein S40542_10620 [Pseudoalteromonas luteoviolacea]AOT18100.1 hypothetical protein S4054_10620 [Pseudoalteromonas luteoviolacea]KKE84207.1 hypothetical protein N479_09925 [Pseudoalteromonas luteoviolacea S4054]KZN76188.1 hypothetical protein N481_07490 [Pseudoalteromonas luteoviolacea S4047-1]
MDNNEFEQLSSLWQSTEKKPQPHMDKLLKRHKRQSAILKFNVCFEAVAILSVCYLLADAFIDGKELFKLSWIGFVTLWAIVIFILTGKSRLDSLSQLKSENINTSLEVHKNLLRNEVYRWTLYAKGTWVFILGFGLFNLGRCYSVTCEVKDLTLEGGLLLGLLFSIVFYKYKNEKAKEVLQTLEQ